MKEVTIWEMLKLQIDNLELLHKQHEQGVDVSNHAYWQLETLDELLESVGKRLGVTDEVRGQFL